MIPGYLRRNRIAASACESILADTVHIDPLAASVLAREALRVEREDALTLAAKLGFDARAEARLPLGDLGFYSAGLILYRPLADAELITLTVLHEIAHGIVDRRRLLHTHGDVWRVTLALCAEPMPAPSWALDLRNLMILEAGEVAA